jgi:dipeptidyl aminopeptidase/acylaminoacyl peptidase
MNLLHIATEGSWSSLLQSLNPVDLFFRAAVETGLSYSELEEMNVTAFEKMRKCSPIIHISSVVAPTLLLLGSKDKRVPSSQGIHYYNRLLSNNVKTKYVDTSIFLFIH